MTAPPTVWHANADVSIRRDQYDTHGRLRVMDAISRDASGQLHRQIEKLVLTTPPGTRLCLHAPEAWITERGDYGSGNEVTRFQQFVHIVDGDACPGASRPRIRSGAAVVYASPWPCAFCWRRQAYNFEQACPGCLDGWSRRKLSSGGGIYVVKTANSAWWDLRPGGDALYVRNLARRAQHLEWMRGYRQEREAR